MVRERKIRDWKIGSMEDWEVGRLGDWEIGSMGALCVSSENCALIDFDDDVFLFDGDGEGVGDIRTFFAFRTGCLNVFAAFDLDFVFPDAALGRTPPRLPGFDVEFPTVPRASEHLAFAGVVIGAWGRGF